MSETHTIKLQAGNVTEFRDKVLRPVCSCGWTGRQRKSRDGAMGEAQKHIAALARGGLDRKDEE